MTKTELIETIADHLGISRTNAKKFVETFADVVVNALQNGEKVNITGFGAFFIEKKSPRVGRDPRNGAPISIPAKNVVKFRPGQEFADQIAQAKV
jgi:DNA-binding protein HU-beta